MWKATTVFYIGYIWVPLRIYVRLNLRSLLTGPVQLTRKLIIKSNWKNDICVYAPECHIFSFIFFLRLLFLHLYNQMTKHQKIIDPNNNCLLSNISLDQNCCPGLVSDYTTSDLMQCVCFTSLSSVWMEFTSEVTVYQAVEKDNFTFKGFVVDDDKH